MTDEHGSTVAGTKLRPPTLPDRLVKRSRLDDALDAGIGPQLRLVLASAPAGSGKSTLLAGWLAGRSEAVAWLQLEPSDSDPARFWTYLVAALGLVQPEMAGRLRQTVVGSNGDEFVVVPALVNELSALAEPLIVVIDDYHLIENAAVHEGMERLIDLCPEAITIVCSTRVDPPFRLGRLRVRNHMIEIRASDLQFDSSEASGLLGSAGESLDPELLALLWERTEGWAAGLVLAGISLGRSTNQAEFVAAFHGDDKLVVDYLSDEFLRQVSADHRQRLLETSILEQFDGSLVDAVTATAGGSEWLRSTADVNQLLIGLDSTGEWFRYHHLFRDLLRLEAQRAFPDRLPELHSRAAEWFESQGDIGQAITHHLEAGSPRDAARLMYSYGPRLITEGQIGTLRGILDQLGDVAHQVAWCALCYGWVEFIDGHYSLSEKWLNRTLELVPDDFDAIITTPLKMNISLGRGDVGSALAIAAEMSATDQLSSNTSVLSVVVGGTLVWAGQAAEARIVLELAVEKAIEEDARANHLLSCVYQAVLEFDDCGAAIGRAAAIAAIETADELSMPSYMRMAPAYAIRASTATAAPEALAGAKHAVELARRAPGALALAYVLAVCGDTLLEFGDTDGESLLVEATAMVDQSADPGIVGRLLARVESRHSIAHATELPATELVEALTERETAVLRYLPTRMSQREISSELFVSVNTVKTHCSAIYRKLGVDGRKAAVQMARDLGLL
ncbi:MAG: LuxR family maltose regulon positive regulatory protein [Acidimicrobiales bacterium]|jgi:LuxR family maltose regulon positive regulatory protein